MLVLKREVIGYRITEMRNMKLELYVAFLREKSCNGD